MSYSKAPFDATLMERAIGLAKKSRPSPNPRVGAVVVKDGKVIGEGYHSYAGGAHAEVVALERAGQEARGADLYVTLEPCVHHGRTGPCVERIIESGISRVAVGMLDPDKRVAGRGISYLEDAGLTTFEGLKDSECKELLYDYEIHRSLGRPGITLKAAITLDGYIAAKSGDSKWISSDASRRIVHEMRAKADAILVGVQTVLQDDPMLTVRACGGDSPLRVVLDSELRCPLNAKLVKSALDVPVLIIHCRGSKESIAQFNRIQGVETVRCDSMPDGRIELHGVVRILDERGVLGVLVEGGSAIFSSFFSAKLVDRLDLFIAPKVLGEGIPWIAYPKAQTVSEGLSFTDPVITQIGSDLLYQVDISNSTIQD